MFLFGINNPDKAKVVTITLLEFIRVKADFDSFIVFQEVGNIPSRDQKRLMNIGGEMISSLDAKDDFARKLRKKAA